LGSGAFSCKAGWAGTPHYGWSCESIEAIDVVLADGTKIRASDDENADLLWNGSGAGRGFPASSLVPRLKTFARRGFLVVARPDLRSIGQYNVDGFDASQDQP